MSRERYAVVSCHVERPLDDVVWARFSAVQIARPAGFAIAALLRPPVAEAGESFERWLERAREAAARGPLGQHTHWTAPDHARPTSGDTAERVLAEGRQLAAAGIPASCFCGGGWYTDADVADACAELGYVDLTPRARRPPYLAAGERWASLPVPAHVSLPSGRTLRTLPTTHTLGDLARAVLRPSLPPFVHVYFHDTDLLERRRAAALRVLLTLLARRARVVDVDVAAGELLADAPRVAWADVARL